MSNEKKIMNKENINFELLKEFEYCDVLLAISKAIIEYREKNNLTQKQLAEKLNTTQVMVSKMESGTYNFSVKKLVELWFDLSDKNNSMGEEILIDILDKVKKNYTSRYLDSKDTKVYTYKLDNIKNRNMIKITREKDTFQNNTVVIYKDVV